jgi:hypothetical protein
MSFDFWLIMNLLKMVWHNIMVNMIGYYIYYECKVQKNLIFSRPKMRILVYPIKKFHPSLLTSLASSISKRPFIYDKRKMMRVRINFEKTKCYIYFWVRRKLEIGYFFINFYRFNIWSLNLFASFGFLKFEQIISCNCENLFLQISVLSAQRPYSFF